MTREGVPQVGVGVIVKKDGKVLLGKRKGKHGAGTWSFPGGHLEFMEHIEECAQRETFEETGIHIRKARVVTCTESFFKETHLHYVTVAVIADFESGELHVKEPDKFETWEWFDWEKLPEPLFLPTASFIEQEINPFI